MAQPVEHLVGRTRELEVLDDALGELDRGRPRTVALVGEPGIGKTRLLAELAGRADERGHLVLSGSCSELERDLPFWAFVDALDEYVAGLDPRWLGSLHDDVRGELALILPSLSTPAADQQATQHDERYRVVRAVRELLERLSETVPLVLVLDDLHWADPASADLIGALLRRPPAAPVLMALAMRPQQVPARLTATLGRAHRTGSLVRCELGALSKEESRELLGAAVEAATAEELYEECGGNPFYLEQLCRSLDRGGDPTGAGASLEGVSVPAAVATALTEELALLSEAARLGLEGAAVVGEPFEPELAAAAAALSEASSAEALDELLRLDLVRHTDVPRRFRFRHPLVRRAVYEATPGGWRLGAHERSAEALAARGASPAARAPHIALSARHGDTDAAAVLRAAGELAAQHAPASAARWFADALRLLPDATPVEQRLELLAAQAGALAASGQYAEAHSILLESLAVSAAVSLSARVQLVTACAGVEHLLGRHDDAHARLYDALSDLGDSSSPERVALMLELATDGFYRMEYGPMREWAARALAAARPLGHRSLTAAAAAAAAWAGALDGAIAAAEADRREAAALVDAMPDHELALRLDAAVSLAGAELYLDRFEEAGAHAERAIAVGRATGQTAVVPMTSSILAWVRMVLGQLAMGGAELDAAIESARLAAHVQTLALHLLNRSLTALAAGDLEMALATAHETFDLTRPMDQSLITAAAGLALGAALVEAGDPERAVEALVGRCGEEVALMPGGFRAKWLELLTRCWLALDRRGEAARAAACARSCAHAVGLGMATAMAERAAAAVALASGDPAEAARWALTSAAVADEAGVLVEAGLSRTLAGRALAQAGQPERAAQELERAAGDLHACGALRYRDEAERELRQLGRRIHRRSGPGSPGETGVASLTTRELQVARLVADRKTNAAIASELFLSQKTVETHVRNMFRKLAVSSRVEIARIVTLADHADGTT